VRARTEVFLASELIELFHDEPELLAIADAIAVTQPRPRRLASRQGASALAGLALAAVSAVAFIMLGGRAPSARAETRVDHLAAYNHLVRARSEASLSPATQRFINQMAANVGGRVVAIQEPISGEASVYLVDLRPTDLCVVIALTGATGSCHAALRQAGGAIEADVAIVDGKTFVLGLARDDVTGVTVAAAPQAGTATQTFKADLTHNTFLAALPFGQHGTGPLEVNVTLHDGSARTVEMPGIPTPRTP
jgi:hypothetical protein